MKAPSWQVGFTAIAVVLSYLVGSSVRGAERAHWKPPVNPDPQAILSEAQNDAMNKRYEDALAKHIWFHECALKIDPALYGVRLSFALAYWADLGKSYPPALAKLKSIRGEDESRIRAKSDSRALFDDIVAIDKYIEELDRTTELFVWLDANDHKFAEKVYELAQPALVKSKEYKICGEYLHAERSYERLLELFLSQQEVAKTSRYGSESAKFGRKSFSNGVVTLVALLVQNDRQDEANRIADKAVKEFDAPEFVEQLDNAKKGHVPEPWL